MSITALKLLKKYQVISRNTKAELIDIGQVITDLYSLVMEQRTRRIPKNER